MDSPGRTAYVIGGGGDPGVGSAPRWGQDFRQGHRLEQGAQGGLVDHRSRRARNGAEARTCR